MENATEHNAEQKCKNNPMHSKTELKVLNTDYKMKGRN